MSLFLAIESVDRASGSSHQFTYQLPYSIKNIRRISLINAEIPNTCYNVRSPYNIFTFVSGPFEEAPFYRQYTATVAEGSYTASTLLTALATAMNTVDTSTTFSFSVSSSTLKITMTASNSVMIGNTYLSRSLGFVSGQTGTSITATNTYVIGDTFLFIQVRNLPTNIISTASSHFRIPLKADSGYIEFYSATDSTQQFIDMDCSTLGHLDVCLVDQYGQPVSLNGAEWSLFLRVDVQ